MSFVSCYCDWVIFVGCLEEECSCVFGLQGYVGRLVGRLFFFCQLCVLYIVDLEASVRRRISHFFALFVGGRKTHLGRLQNDATV